jgi:iron(III) transport system substrate-binding protein
MMQSKLLLAGGAALLSIGLAQPALSADQMTVYCPMSENDCTSVLKAFEDDTGYTSAFVRLGAGEILARIRAEKNNPQAALWLAGAADIFIQGASEGLLEAHESANIAGVAAAHRDPENFWTPIAVSPIGFAYNADYVAELGAEPPTSWEDFADPVFKDAVALAHPAASGTAYVSLAAMVQLYGEDKAFEIMKGTDANVVQYTRSGSAPSRMAASGEVAIAMAFTQDLEALIAQGFPISVSFPEEGTGFEINAAGLVANAPEGQRDAAKAFLDWILSDKGQQAISATYRGSALEAYDNPTFNIDLQAVKLIDYDSKWAGENRSRLLEHYENAVRNVSDAK